MTTQHNPHKRRARRVLGVTALAGVSLSGSLLTMQPASALAPSPCGDITTVDAGEVVICTLAAGATIEFTLVGGNGGDGGAGGAGGTGYSDPDVSAGPGGDGGLGGFGGAGGTGATVIGSYTNDSDESLTIVLTAGVNGDNGEAGFAGADGSSDSPFGNMGEPGSNGEDGTNSVIALMGDPDPMDIAVAYGGIGGTAGTAGTGGLPGEPDGVPGLDGFPGVDGVNGDNGGHFPDPLLDNWSTQLGDGTPRIELNVTSTDPEHPACAELGTVGVESEVPCTVAPGETIEFTLVSGDGGDGGDGGNGGDGGSGWTEEFESPVPGGLGGLGGVGGFGGHGVTVTGSWTNDTDAAVTLVATVESPALDGQPGVNGETPIAPNAIGGYTGDNGTNGTNGSNGGNGAAAFLSFTFESPLVAYAGGGDGGEGGFGGLGGLGGQSNGSVGENGDNGAAGANGNNGFALPDPLPAGWTVSAGDNDPRIVFGAADDDTTPPTPSPNPNPGPSPAPFTPLVPDQSDSTAGSTPGVIEFSNLPAGAVVTVPADAPDTVKGVGSVTIVDNVVTVTPDKGFSGIIKMPVSVNVGGQVTTVEVTITVNPAPASAGEFAPSTNAQWWPSPRAASGTTIVWDASENAVGYEVYLVIPAVASGLSAQSVNKVLLCTATASSCTVNRLVGPGSTLELVATGNDGTRSTTTLPKYSSSAFTRVLNVMFGGNSAKLTAISKAELDLLAFVMRSEGFSEVHITSHISSNRSTKFGRELSRKRAEAVSKYLSPLVGSAVTVTFESKVNASPVASNSTREGREANRRVEVSIR